jgi:hypothetical protein
MRLLAAVRLVAAVKAATAARSGPATATVGSRAVARDLLRPDRLFQFGSV